MGLWLKTSKGIHASKEVNEMIQFTVQKIILFLSGDRVEQESKVETEE